MTASRYVADHTPSVSDTLYSSNSKWLRKNGGTGQWGTEKASEQPRRIGEAQRFIASGGTWLAYDRVSPAGIEDPSAATQERVLGAVTVTDKASYYVSPATEPELFINFLITDPAHGAGRRVGDLLVGKAKELASEEGVKVIRVDCYNGPDGKLVQWYEKQGFQKVETFVVKEWPGQLLMMRLD